MEVSIHDFPFGINIEEMWIFHDHSLRSFPSWENSSSLEIGLPRKSLRRENIVDALRYGVRFFLCLHIRKLLLTQNLFSKILVTVWNIRENWGDEGSSFVVCVCSIYALMSILNNRAYFSFWKEIVFSFVSCLLDFWHLRLCIVCMIF